jgi:hypothetical protein
VAQQQQAALEQQRAQIMIQQQQQQAQHQVCASVLVSEVDNFCSFSGAFARKMQVSRVIMPFGCSFIYWTTPIPPRGSITLAAILSIASHHSNCVIYQIQTIIPIKPSGPLMQGGHNHHHYYQQQQHPPPPQQRHAGGISKRQSLAQGSEQQDSRYNYDPRYGRQ